MFNTKRNLFIAGLFISGSLILTGCNTVKGTAQGAAKDIKNVTQTVTDQPAPKKRVVKKTSQTHHNKTVKKSNAQTTVKQNDQTTVKSTNQSTTVKTTDQNTSTEPNNTTPNSSSY